MYVVEVLIQVCVTVKSIKNAPDGEESFSAQRTIGFAIDLSIHDLKNPRYLRIMKYDSGKSVCPFYDRPTHAAGNFCIDH